MPDFYMSLFPHTQNNLELIKASIQAGVTFSEMARKSVTIGFDMIESTNKNHIRNLHRFLSPFLDDYSESSDHFFYTQQKTADTLISSIKKDTLESIDLFLQDKRAELEFIKVFTEKPAIQDWSFEYDDSHVLLDLPGLRLSDHQNDFENMTEFGRNN